MDVATQWVEEMEAGSQTDSVLNSSTQTIDDLSGEEEGDVEEEEEEEEEETVCTCLAMPPRSPRRLDVAARRRFLARSVHSTTRRCAASLPKVP